MKKIIISLATCALLGTASVAAAAPSTIQATISKFKIIVNGQIKSNSSNVILYKGTTYVPIREAANLFDYKTAYYGAAQAIEFRSNHKQDKWVTLSELQSLNSVSIVQKADGSKGAYDIKSNGSILFSVYSDQLNDGDSTIVYISNNKPIHVKKTLGAVVLNGQDLLNAGFKIY
ncbi:hypothetical protein DCC85_08595 [Paenibacillus sp. CAA11]|uniref:stalk domain-containing protein n=1 Tax=Paenibacillus sp. CAA11 TaxID=1532905 RepID=UPI000D39A2AC|nr:stalk domain-containing protein [Paenibacillus sp. CAA11]AWB44269.1 hypothetical protein DCC85_08595 [Paenibacillus sp. CAA11]